MKTSDVVIAGGGVPGLTLGCLLARAGLDVCVVDPARPPLPQDVKQTGRTSALMEDSLGILDRAGLWEPVAETATDLRRLALIDAVQQVTFSAEELGKPRFGCNVVNTILLAHAAQIFASLPQARLIHGSVKAFEASAHGVEIETSDGTRLRTPLLVGADGRNSVVRIASGIACRDHDYDQMALTALLTHTRPHDFTSTEFHRPGGPFTLVPMPGLMSSLVWLDRRDAINRALTLSRHDLELQLQEFSQNILGEIRLATTPEAWPLKVMQAKSYTARRVALIAEAAHVLSPIGAQGLNLSLRDTRTLADIVIDAAGCGLDIGSPAVLKKYEDSRTVDIGLRVAGAHVLNEIVATDNTMLTGLRQMGLRLVSSLSPLRRLAMQEGLTSHQNSHSPGVSGRTTRARVKTSTR